MLHGIDISSWQADLDLAKVDVDFCIVKATQGTSYINPSCDKHIQQAIKKGIKWGFYHFADGGDARKEAQFFYRNCSGYVGNGIPVLDFEINTGNDAAWCEKFVDEYHRLTNVWCVLYISASRCPAFNSSWIPSKCGLWVAGYPQNFNAWTNTDMPYSVKPWEFAAIWQFTSSLKLRGYAGNLDGNIAYMDKTAWDKYASSKKVSSSDKIQPTLSYSDLAVEIFLGEWGNGEDRKRLLKEHGYDYETAQGVVNEYSRIADECIKGIWGNGWNRKTALESHGYDYNAIQTIVNRKLGY